MKVIGADILTVCDGPTNGMREEEREEGMITGSGLSAEQQMLDAQVHPTVRTVITGALVQNSLATRDCSFCISGIICSTQGASTQWFRSRFKKIMPAYITFCRSA